MTADRICLAHKYLRAYPLVAIREVGGARSNPGKVRANLYSIVKELPPREPRGPPSLYSRNNVNIVYIEQGVNSLLYVF